MEGRFNISYLCPTLNLWLSCPHISSKSIDHIDDPNFTFLGHFFLNFLPVPSELAGLWFAVQQLSQGFLCLSPHHSIPVSCFLSHCAVFSFGLLSSFEKLHLSVLPEKKACMRPAPLCFFRLFLFFYEHLGWAINSELMTGWCELYWKLPPYFWKLLSLHFTYFSLLMLSLMCLNPDPCYIFPLQKFLGVVFVSSILDVMEVCPCGPFYPHVGAW